MCVLASQAQNKQVRLQLKWWHQFQFAGYYAASIKGFYNDAGIDVRIIPGDAKHPPLQEVIQGKADFAVTGSDLLLNYLNGDRVEALGAIFQHSAYVILSAAEKNIKKPRDLISKKIMASKDQGWVQLEAILVKEKIDLNSVNIIPHTWDNNDILNGNADAMTAYASVEAIHLQTKGVPVNMIRPIDYGIDFYGDILFTLKENIAADPELTAKFTEASFKGWEYAMTHQEEMAKYILSLPGVQERGVTYDALLKEAKVMEPLVMSDLVQIGHMNANRWEHMLNIYQSLDLAPKGKTIDGFMYDKNARSFNKYKKLALYIFIIVLGVLMILLLYSLNLKRAVQNRTRDLLKEIQERKNTEAALRELSGELQVSNNELQQFAYLSSHNMRAPVMNLISLLKLFDKAQLSEKNLLYLEKIQQSSQSLNTLVNDLNEIVAARKTERTEWTLLQFDAELKNVCEMISEHIKETGTEIIADFSKAGSLYYSRKILQSIFLNLLTNAIKYRHPERKCLVEISSWDDQDYIYLKVRDNGKGIDLNKFAGKVFKIYQRFDPEVEGKGLGLYLIRTQLEATGDSIKISESSPEGTTFLASFRKFKA
jgi:signal transduction histidine kinase